MKLFIYIIVIMAILYILRVPNVVTFVNQVFAVIHTVIAYILDELTHVRERHPFIFISIPALLFYLMFAYRRSIIDA